jgi:hypothetical protein
MKQLYVLLFLFVCAPTLGQSWKWVKLGEKNNNIYLSDITTDQSGNVYTTGAISGTGSFACTNVYGLNQMVITKYDASGQAIWARSTEGTGSSKGNSIRTNTAGDAYVMSEYRGKMKLGPFNVREPLSEALFLSKFNKDGQVSWVNSIYSKNYGYVKGVEADVDATGNMFVLGTFNSTATVGESDLSSHSTPGHGWFVVAYDSSGKITWVQNFGKDIIPSSISVDSDGNCLVTGTFSGSQSFGPINLTSKGETDIFIAKYGLDGKVIWAKAVGNSGWASSSKIEVDKSGNFYLLGSVRLSAEFGDIIFYGSGFYAKYNGNGDVIWVKNVSGSGTVNVFAIFTGDDDESYILGNFYGTMTLGDFDLISLKNTSMVIAKYNALGHVSWVEQIDSKRDVYGRSFSADTKGNIYVTGEQSDISYFQNITFAGSTKGSWSHFIGKLAPAGAAGVGAPGVATSYCAGSTASVSFTTSGSFAPGNTFTVQLSDAAGCFTSPLEIGSGSASPVSVSFSENLTGSGYRMRVVSSAPYAVGVESAADIAIYQPPVVSLQALEEVVCSSTTDLVLTGGAPAGGTYAGPGVANGIFNAAVAGAGTHEITYTYTNSYGCQASAVQPITVATCTGIRDRELERNAQLYPNPTTGKFMLTVPLPAAGDVLVRVVNLQGRAVLEKAYGRQHGEFTAQLDLSAQAKGLYLLQILLDQQLLVKQVVLQ